LAFRNCLPSESDSLLGIEDGPLPDERLYSTSTTVDLVQGYLSDNLRSVVPAEGQKPSCYDFEIIVPYLRSFLICSIFSGNCSAKRSFKVLERCQERAWLGRTMELRYLSFRGRVASQAIEGSGSRIESRGSERGSQRRRPKTECRSHCECAGWEWMGRWERELLVKVCSPRKVLG
jgi:hypothetical protein